MLQEETVEEAPKVSKYNSAIDQLQRIGEIYRDCHKHSRQKDYDAWNEDLDAVWRELAGDIQEDDDDFKSMGEINKEIIKLYPLMRPNYKGFNPPVAGDIKRAQEQKAHLAKKELFLRRLQNKLGKGTAYDEDDDFIE